MWIRIKICCALMLSFCMFTVQANTSNIKMISTLEMVNQVDRAEAEADLKNLVSSDEVKDVLLDYGLTSSEVESRIAGLSDVELNNLHSEIEQAKKGGILVTILVVLLIIFIAQRI